MLVRVCGWAPCQPLSDSTPSRWRIFVSETNGTERINYRHNVGDMPELQGGGGENKPFPCTLRFSPLLLSPHRPPMSTNGRLRTVTCPFSSRHQASVWSTAGRWHPFQTLPRSHSRTPSSEKTTIPPPREGEGHPAAWKHSSNPPLSVAIFYHLQFSLEAL